MKLIWYYIKILLLLQDENLIEKIHDNIPKLSLFDRVHKKDPNIF